MKVTIMAAKAALRKTMKETMKNLAPEDRAEQSRLIIEKLMKTPEWTNAKRVSIFLAMPNEVQTEGAAFAALRSGKQVFVPLCAGGNMRMLRVRSEEDLKTLPRDAWGIKEPKPVEGRDDALETGGLDLVVCPGVAFTSKGQRCGYGKGYYDGFLTKLRNLPKTGASNKGVTIAVAFRQQVLDEIPVTEADVTIDQILTADS